MKNTFKKISKKAILSIGIAFGFIAAVAYSTGAYTWQTVGGATGKFYNGVNSLDAVYDLGKVGIGTTTPAFDLHVEGTTNLGGNVYHNGTRVNIGGKWTDGASETQAVYQAGNVGIGLLNPLSLLHVSQVGGANGILIDNPAGTANKRAYRFDIPGGAAERLQIQAMQDSGVWARDIMVLEHDGNVGIGLTNPGVDLQVAGTITSDEFIYSSDRRLKENIVKLSNYSNVLNLTPVKFDWKEKDGEGVDTGDIGFVAQEVEKYFPNLVTERDDSYKGVNYQKLIVPMLAVLKDQQAEIEKLKAEIEKLK